MKDVRETKGLEVEEKGVLLLVLFGDAAINTRQRISFIIYLNLNYADVSHTRGHRNSIFICGDSSVPGRSQPLVTHPSRKFLGQSLEHHLFHASIHRAMTLK